MSIRTAVSVRMDVSIRTDVSFRMDVSIRTDVSLRMDVSVRTHFFVFSVDSFQKRQKSEVVTSLLQSASKGLSSSNSVSNAVLCPRFFDMAV